MFLFGVLFGALNGLAFWLHTKSVEHQQAQAEAQWAWQQAYAVDG